MAPVSPIDRRSPACRRPAWSSPSTASMSCPRARSAAIVAAANAALHLHDAPVQQPRPRRLDRVLQGAGRNRGAAPSPAAASGRCRSCRACPAPAPACRRAQADGRRHRDRERTAALHVVGAARIDLAPVEEIVEANAGPRDHDAAAEFRAEALGDADHVALAVGDREARWCAPCRPLPPRASPSTARSARRSAGRRARGGAAPRHCPARARARGARARGCRWRCARRPRGGSRGTPCRDARRRCIPCLRNRTLPGSRSVSRCWNPWHGGGRVCTARPRYGPASGSRQIGRTAFRSSSVSTPPSFCTCATIRSPSAPPCRYPGPSAAMPSKVRARSGWRRIAPCAHLPAPPV